MCIAEKQTTMTSECLMRSSKSLSGFKPHISGVVHNAPKMLITSCQSDRVALMFTNCMKKVITAWSMKMALPVSGSPASQSEHEPSLSSRHVGSHRMTQACIQQVADHDTKFVDKLIC